MVKNCNAGQKIGFIGAGKMASAIMGGIIKSGFFPKENIYAFDVNQDAIKRACDELGVCAANSIKDLLSKVQIVLIATKPFVIQNILDEMKDSVNNQLIISILAGVKTSTIEQKLKSARVIRVMPNTPAFVNEGMCAAAKGKYANDSDCTFVLDMLSNIGRTVEVKEDVIDAVTAVSGSGPAYYYYIIDTMARAGEKLGLDYDTALLLSAQTALGSAKMMLENNQTPKELITAVTTPGGCTEVGNNVLKDSDLEQIIDKTIKDTMDKAKALG